MNTKNTSMKPLLAIVGVNFIWGFDFIAIEYMMGFMSPAMFTFVRLIIGSVLLTACVFLFRGGLHIKREDMPRIFISGAIGMSVYFTIENLGTGLTSASFSSLIMATVPIFGMIGDHIFYGNKITPLKVVCILASILGVYLLVSGEPMGISAIGVLAMFAAAIAWTIYIVVVKPLYEKYDLLTLLTGLFLSGLIVQIPIVAVSQAVTHTPIVVTPMGILVTLATAIVCIIIGEFGYIYAVGKLSTTLVAAFENVLPVTAVIFSIFIFGKILTVTQIIGGVIILIAVTTIAFLERNKE
ncbi:MAG: EamA family transporter [Firmicutes bacterium]|nr:EamA family transporter [Bacillota bacterium]